MRWLVVALVVGVLGACGKREEPIATRVEKLEAKDPRPKGCIDVVILKTERQDLDTINLFESVGYPKIYRYVRTGDFGSVGDKFTYCE